MKKILDSQVWLFLASLSLSLLLFLTATSNSYSQSGSQGRTPTETYTHTLTNVPIDIKYDSDKYFISGYSYETEVYLTSVNRVKLDAEINRDTRNFNVVADLTSLAAGTQTVNLEIVGLPAGVTGTAMPATFSVTIGEKASKTFEVKGHVADNQLASGYALKKISTDITEAEVTSDESIIAQIDHVVARLPEDEVLDSDYSRNVTLQAVSADGTILAGVIKPSKAVLTATVKKLTKTVPLTIKANGDLSEKVSDISYKLSQETVVISGSQESLDAVSEIVAEVDISNVTKTTSRTINLSAEDVTVEPSVVTVQLTVTEK